MRAKRLIHISEYGCSGCMRCALSCLFLATRERAFNPAKVRIQVTPAARDVCCHVQYTPECTSCSICSSYCQFGAPSETGTAE